MRVSQDGGARKGKRQPPRRQHRPIAEPPPPDAATDELTAEEFNAFAFLFDPLRRSDRKRESRDLEAILRRCKAKGIDLVTPSEPGPPRSPALDGLLLFDLAELSNDPPSVMLRDTQECVDQGARAFLKARGHFARVPALFALPELGVPASALFELLEACAVMVQGAQAKARQMVTRHREIESRAPAKATGLRKKTPGRPSRGVDLRGLQVSQGDMKNLRRIVGVVASVAPIRSGVGATVSEVGYTRCRTCNSPAPALFTRQRT